MKFIDVLIAEEAVLVLAVFVLPLTDAMELSSNK